MKQRIRSSFNRACRTYLPAARIQERVASSCAGLVPARSYPTALEIGAGGGLLSSLLLQKVDCTTYIALDLAERMLACLDPGGLPGLVRLMADGERPPLRPCSCDLLVSASTLQWYLEPERSIPGNLELLRSKGCFAFSLYVDGTLPEMAEVVAATGEGSMHALRQAGFYVELLRRSPDLRFEFWEDTQVQYLPTVSQLLATLKRTGATATAAKRPLSRTGLQRFIRMYEERFATARGIPATYKILHLWGMKT